MATDTRPTPLGEMRGVGASTGVVLGTTPVTAGIPKGTQFLILEGRSYTTAVVARVALNPYLVVYKTADNLATITDYSDAAQDADAATDVVLSSLDTLANGDALWVGSHLPFRGLSVDVDAANGTASVLTGKYWNGTELVDISLTDGTDSAGATLGADGAITWTVPTAWAAASLATAGGGAQTIKASGVALYWVQLVVSAALDSSTTLNSIHALNRATSYFELPTGREREIAIRRGVGGVGSIEAATDAGTAALLVTAATYHGGRFL